MTVSKKRKNVLSPERIILKKYFGDLKVIEAKHGLRIQPNESDIKNAVRGDARNCVFSKACQRMWSSIAVVFFGTVAYVDLLDKKGVRNVERFNISSEGQRFINAVDTAKTKAQVKKLILELKSFWLLAPTKSQTAKYCTERAKKSHAKRRKAILLGQTIVKGRSHTKRKPSAMRLSNFYRDGRGMAQFPRSA